MSRNWRLQCFNLLNQMTNELGIDIGELFYEYNFSDREIKDYYKFIGE